MEDLEETLQQQNVGPGNEAGSGEWPSPGEPPTGPAPGTDPAARQRIEQERSAATGGADAVQPVLDTVDPAEAGSRTQQDPGSPKPAPEG